MQTRVRNLLAQPGVPAPEPPAPAESATRRVIMLKVLLLLPVDRRDRPGPDACRSSGLRPDPDR
jgi:hypothetical protein